MPAHAHHVPRGFYYIILDTGTTKVNQFKKRLDDKSCLDPLLTAFSSSRTFSNAFHSYSVGASLKSENIQRCLGSE